MVEIIADIFLEVVYYHTANLSWQTHVGKPKLVCVNGTKQAANTFANCWRQIERCLPTVFMPFTQTNLNLPTLVCRVKAALFALLAIKGRSALAEHLFI